MLFRSIALRGARRLSVVVCLAVLLCCNFSLAGDVVLTTPGYDHINATALDQPELNAVLTDGGTVITEDGNVVIIEMFIDTGSSSFVISHLNAVGYDYEPTEGFGYVHVPSLGLDGDPNGEFTGVYTEVGVSGTELGDVTRDFGIKILSGAMGSSSDPNDFADFGAHSLWVRRAPGIGEIVSVSPFTLVDPVNVAGMPLISQRVMAMDPAPMAGLGRMVTHMLPVGDPAIPQTNVTFSVYLDDFVGDPPPGETLPSHADNPVVRNITIKHTRDGNTLSIADNDWLFDTGSASTFMSFAKAQAVSLIAPSYADLNDYLPDHIAAGGLVNEIGGIGGGTVIAPILRIDEIRIAAREGFDVVWQNIDVLVVDIEVPTSPGETLEGVLGLNLLVPAATVDPNDPLGWLDDISLGYFDAIVFDATNSGNVKLRLYCELAPEAPLIGDMDSSGKIDSDDINPFILAMTDPNAYFAQYGLNPDFVGDCDDSGKLDTDDIDDFIAKLLAGSQAVPEPATLSLLILGGVASLVRRRRMR